MADMADFANDLVQERIDLALKARKAKMVFASYEVCMDCGMTIPLARREGVDNCTRCRECQELSEKVGARYAR